MAEEIIQLRSEIDSLNQKRKMENFSEKILAASKSGSLDSYNNRESSSPDSKKYKISSMPVSRHTDILSEKK